MASTMAERLAGWRHLLFGTAEIDPRTGGSSVILDSGVTITVCPTREVADSVAAGLPAAASHAVLETRFEWSGDRVASIGDGMQVGFYRASGSAVLAEWYRGHRIAALRGLGDFCQLSESRVVWASDGFPPADSVIMYRFGRADTLAAGLDSIRDADPYLRDGRIAAAVTHAPGSPLRGIIEEVA